MENQIVVTTSFRLVVPDADLDVSLNYAPWDGIRVVIENGLGLMHRWNSQSEDTLEEFDAEDLRAVLDEEREAMVDGEGNPEFANLEEFLDEAGRFDGCGNEVGFAVSKDDKTAILEYLREQS